MEWVDWTKIIGIFLVTLGHGNLVSVELNTFIYSFHMPLFFILSGILFKYRNFIESLKKGWHTLLVPYFIINLIILAYTSILLILKGTFDVQMFLGKVVAVIVGLGYNVGYLSPVSAPTWFLISLFFLHILTSLREDRAYRLLLVLFCIGVFLILQYYEIDTLVPIDSTLLAMPFFIAGYEMKEFFKRDLSFYVVLIIFVALIVFNYYNGRVDINTCQIGNSLLLFYLNGTFGTRLETFGLWFINNKMTIPIERLTAANIIFQLSLLGFCCSLVNTPYLALIIAYEKMKTFAYIGMLEALFKLAIVGILYFVSTDKLIVYGILIFVINVSITLSYVGYVSRKIPQIHYYVYWNKIEIAELASFSGWHLLGTISVVLRGQGINVLLNVFFNPIVNTARAIAFQIESAVMQLQNNFFLALKPQIYKLYAVHDYSQLHTLIVRSTQICFFLTSILSIPLFFELDTVLDLWLVEVPEYTRAFTTLVLLNGLIDSVSGPMIAPILATGKIRNFYLITGNLIIFTLPISYVVLHYGCSPESVFIVTISFSFLAMMCRIYFLHKLIKIPFLEYIIELIKLFIATVVICIVVTLYIYVTPDSAMRFFIVIILSSVLHLIMYYYFVISGNDRKALNGCVSKFYGNIWK